MLILYELFSKKLWEREFLSRYLLLPQTRASSTLLTVHNQFSALPSVMSCSYLEIGHGGTNYTMKMAQHCKPGLPLPDCSLLI